MNVSDKYKSNNEIYYLYKITNKEKPEKFYIGVTNDPERRFRQHGATRENCPKLHRALKKYGRDAFSFSVICIGNVKYILDLEKKYIETSEVIKNGYNCHTGGIGGNVFHRKDDNNQYVSGFWFPNIRTALNSLRMTRRTFSVRKRNGTLGDVCVERWNTDAAHHNAVKISIGGKIFNSINGASRKTGIPVWRINTLLRKEGSEIHYVN